VWRGFLPKLRAVERFLQDYSLRMLFRATCLSEVREISQMFANYSGSHIEWRWEYLEKSLGKLIPLLGHMKTRLNVEAILKSDEGNIDPAVVKEARGALDTPFFTEFCLLVWSLGHAVYMFTHILEGCICHGYVWTGKGNFKTKAKRMFDLTGYKTCFWKGRMGAWLQVVGLPILEQMIRDSTSDRLQGFLTSMSDARRGAFVHIENAVKCSLIEELTQKLAFHKQSPYNSMGMIWGEFPGGDSAIGKAIAKTNVEEYDELIGNGLGDKVHRVAHRLYAKESRIRVELQSWIESSIMSLRCFPVAFVAVLQYALVPLCGRSVEALHARLNRVRRKCTYIKAPALSAGLRFDAHVALLQGATCFKSFCVQHWRSRKLIDDTLSLRLSSSELKELTRPQKIARIYQSSFADEYRDMNFERAQQKQFLALTIHCRSGKPLELSVDVRQCMLLVKAKLSNNAGSVYSLPTAIFDSMLTDSGEWHALHPDAIEMVVNAADVVPFDMEAVEERCRFFSVLNVNPEKRQAVPMHHLPPLSMRIHIVQRTLLASDVANAQVTLSAAPSAKQLSLRPMVMNIHTLLRQLFRWEVVERQSMQAARGPQLMLGSSPQLPSLQLPVAEGALALRAPEQPGPVLAIRTLDSHVESSRVLAAVLEQCSQAGGAIEFTELQGVDLRIVSSLAQQGSLEFVTDDFMITQVAPRSTGIKWESVITCGQPSQSYRFDTYDETCKLDMALWLRRHGFAPAQNPADVNLVGPFEFSLEMRRPASYFLVLIKYADVLAKGVEAIPHDRGDFFYRCLLRLRADQLDVVLRSGESMDDYYRKELKAAFPGGEIEAGATEAGAEAIEADGVVPIVGPLATSETRTWQRAIVSVGGDSGGEPVVFKVYFDFQHHSFGQRGFVQCPVKEHGTCMGHAYTQDFESRAEFCAALHMWASRAGEFENRFQHVALRAMPEWARPLPPTLLVRDF
jgi:hypothetical protein